MSHFTPAQIRMLSEFVSNGLRLIALANKDDLHVQFFINGLQLFFPLFLEGSIDDHIECLDLTPKAKEEIKLLLGNRH